MTAATGLVQPADPAGRGTPDNGAYFHAAYGLVVLIYGGYALTLLRRRASTRRLLNGLSPADGPTSRE